MRILIIGGISRSLVNFRGPLIKAMLAEGHEVIACAGEPHADVAETLKSWGVAFFPIQLARAGLQPAADVKAFIELRRIIQKVQPDCVLAYTIKPIVYGCMAAKSCGISATHGMVEGLGRPFMPVESFSHLISSLIAKTLYRISLPFVSKVFFLNPDDQRHFVQNHYVSKRTSVLLNGIGIDLQAFKDTALPHSQVNFLMIARLLRDKGVREYATAAQLLKRNPSNCTCTIAGDLDANPASISQQELDSWIDEGAVNYLGYLDDVRPAYEQCSVYVLPSYREGTPRTVLEAMAMGKPIITTDVPGCRETVWGRDAYRDEGGNLKAESNRGNTTHQNEETTEGRPAFANATAGKPQTADSPLTPYPLPLTSTKLRFGANGILVPPRDAEALAEAMRFFIDHPEQVAIMGRESRRYAEERYDVHKVNAVMLREMGMMGEDRRL